MFSSSNVATAIPALHGTHFAAQVRRSPKARSMPSRIEDYAIIGDCHTAALVGKDGSIDWLCLPRLDSGACFAALLGQPEHGRWLIAPQGEVSRVERRYRDDTLILETDFQTAEGEVRLIDCMPPRTARPDVERIVEGRRGTAPLRPD